jgi:hypothetical protein
MSDDPNNKMIPIRDGRGNFLAIDNEVLFTGIRDMKHIVGRIVSFDPGGMSIVETNDSKPKQTMAKLRVVFDMIIQIPPQAPFVIDIFRIINPDSETVLSKILDSDLKAKLQ